MPSADLMPLAVMSLYLAATGLFFAAAGASRRNLATAGDVCAGAGFGLHTLDLVWLFLYAQKTALLAGGLYFSIGAWTLLLLYFLIRWRMRSSFLSLAALPLALGLLITAQAVAGAPVRMPPAFTSLFFGLHIATLVLSMGLLVLALGAGVAFLRLNRRIKAKAGLSTLDKDMPSLDVFDRINRLAITAGFPLYTVGILAGFVWRVIDPGRKFVWDQMNITALVVWALFALAFHQRLALGWRGRKPAIMAMVVLAAMLVPLIHHSFK